MTTYIVETTSVTHEDVIFQEDLDSYTFEPTNVLPTAKEEEWDFVAE